MDTDVLVAGGGPAGCATAAALAQLGLRVTIVDAGQDRARQLAGELLHPVGVEDLRALGLGEVLDAPGVQSVVGFAVVDARSSPARHALLPYAEGHRGVAAEHAQLTTPLLEVVGRRENVTVLPKTRLAQVLRNDAQGVEVILTRERESTNVTARLLVVADGRASPVRKMLGLESEHDRVSGMIGVTVDAALLPFAQRGHLFVGGATLVLGYAISPTCARIMVDVPPGASASWLKVHPELLGAVPADLRAGILRALDEDPRAASNERRMPVSITVGSAVLVGDAAGCCHPLSASGMTSCTQDARALQNAFIDSSDDLALALANYREGRRPEQRTRIALASALYLAFSGQGPDMVALREGLFDYWHKSRKGARVSMALLSGREARMWVMAREYSRVVGYGMLALMRDAWSRQLSFSELADAGMGLLGSTLPHVRTTAKGAMEDWGARLGE